jgi:hypothetical protein
MPATIKAVKQTSLLAAYLFVTFLPASHITVFISQLPIKVQGRAVIGLLLRRQFDRMNDRPSPGPGGQLLVAAAACQWATAAGAEEPNTEVTGTQWNRQLRPLQALPVPLRPLRCYYFRS